MVESKDMDESNLKSVEPGRSGSAHSLPIPSDWTTPEPPPHTCNALWQLEALLSQHRHTKKQSKHDVSTSSSCNNNNDDTAMDELLVTVDYLYGTKLLTSALGLVDSCHSLITQVVAPSGRVAYLVRGSKGDETYLCLLSSSQSSATTTTSTTVPSFSGSVHYCSCRSYFESVNRVSVGISLSNFGDLGGMSGNTNPQMFQQTHNHNPFNGPPLCKHLLALKLLPYLEGQQDNGTINHPAVVTPHSVYNKSTATTGTTTARVCPQRKPVTENEFAALLLNHIGMPG
ncbi:hypothetical protein IV203_012226 [Nitzschia inconspicua]|uniref:Uncharacterized protein n=1 Tax=Nitzschia inconspicua TaxID=303405 RepID=A0A9K3KUM0_9STRA|nr:hypothetical protein IV203_012226 [Nitzschia inconspicua]